MTDPNHYQVRLYDVAAGALLPQPVVDKREPNEPMNGIRGDSAADSNGNYVYTVYIRDGGPFIHALPLDEPIAWCVDLPSTASNDMERQFHWALALSHDGRTLYAANEAVGTVAVMTSGEPPTIVRTAPVAMNLPPRQSGGLVTDADAKGPRIGGAALGEAASLGGGANRGRHEESRGERRIGPGQLEEAHVHVRLGLDALEVDSEDVVRLVALGRLLASPDSSSEHCSCPGSTSCFSLCRSCRRFCCS